MKIAGIIILYNELLTESKTYNSIKDQELDLFIWDNSETKELREQNQVVEKNYFTQEKNVGLAKAFNIIIEQLKGNYDYVVTLDSDTIIPSDYITTFKSEIEEDYFVYLPTIYNQEGRKCAPRNHQDKYKKVIFGLDMNIEKTIYFDTINSGVLYNMSVFDKVCFNDNLLVENIDFDMFDKLKRNKIKQKVMTSELNHNLSSINHNSLLDNKRINYTYVDMIEYYGKIWYALGLGMYLKNGIKNGNIKQYVKRYFDIYIK